MKTDIFAFYGCLKTLDDTLLDVIRSRYQIDPLVKVTDFDFRGASPTGPTMTLDAIQALREAFGLSYPFSFEDAVKGLS